jgi:hypothetical protein
MVSDFAGNLFCAGHQDICIADNEVGVGKAK